MDINILTERNYQTWPSWAIVYEWEDVMKKCLDCNLSYLHPTGKIGRKIRALTIKTTSVGRVWKCSRFKKVRLVWVMNAKAYRNYSYKDTIPIFLDFPVNMLEEINYATRNLPCYWVTSLDIYYRLKKLKSSNVYYIPISLPDKYYKACTESNVGNKTIDVIQFGRKNQVLHNYMMYYCSLNPSVEYVYQTYNGSLVYHSTTRGDIGKFDNRKEYTDLLASAKVSLVSSPGADKSRDFGDIDFFTPRFFESASFYCHMIGRYTENEESEVLGIKDICPNVETQEDFNYILTNMLETDNVVNFNRYDEFLKRNLTSVRMREVKSILENKLNVEKDEVK